MAKEPPLRSLVVELPEPVLLRVVKLATAKGVSVHDLVRTWVEEKTDE